MDNRVENPKQLERSREEEGGAQEEAAARVYRMRHKSYTCPTCKGSVFFGVRHRCKRRFVIEVLPEPVEGRKFYCTERKT